MAEEIKLQPVGQMQPAQPAPEQKEMLPSYSERYYDDYFEYRCALGSGLGYQLDVTTLACLHRAT